MTSAQAKSDLKFPLRYAARQAINKALKSGKISRPRCCEGCGLEPPLAKDGRSMIHGHHYLGYERPMDVKWLCPACHAGEDVRASGSNNGRAKLTPDQVCEIRRRYRPGSKNHWDSEGSARAMAREYGVSDRTIRNVVRQETWIAAALK